MQISKRELVRHIMTTNQLLTTHTKENGKSADELRKMDESALFNELEAQTERLNQMVLAWGSN